MGVIMIMNNFLWVRGCAAAAAHKDRLCPIGSWLSLSQSEPGVMSV